MTAFRLAPAVSDAFPDTLVAVVTATGLRGREDWPDTAAALGEPESQPVRRYSEARLRREPLHAITPPGQRQQLHSFTTSAYSQIKPHNY